MSRDLPNNFLFASMGSPEYESCTNAGKNEHYYPIHVDSITKAQ